MCPVAYQIEYKEALEHILAPNSAYDRELKIIYKTKKQFPEKFIFVNFNHYTKNYRNANNFHTKFKVFVLAMACALQEFECIQNGFYVPTTQLKHVSRVPKNDPLGFNRDVATF